MTNPESDLDRITKSWAATFTEEVLLYAKPATVNDMEVGSGSRPPVQFSFIV